jgi:hypothetical protein
MLHFSMQRIKPVGLPVNKQPTNCNVSPQCPMQELTRNADVEAKGSMEPSTLSSLCCNCCTFTVATHLSTMLTCWSTSYGLAFVAPLFLVPVSRSICAVLSEHSQQGVQVQIGWQLCNPLTTCRLQTHLQPAFRTQHRWNQGVLFRVCNYIPMELSPSLLRSCQ